MMKVSKKSFLFFVLLVAMGIDAQARYHWYFNTFAHGSGPASSTTGKIITTSLIICAAFAWHYYKNVYSPQQSIGPAAQVGEPSENFEHEDFLDELVQARIPLFNACFHDEKQRLKYSESYIPYNKEHELSPLEHVVFGKELTKKPTLLLCIHGTWSNATELGHLDAKQPVACAIKNFARHLVQYTQTPVELISFNWSGSLSHEARQKAGHELAQLILNKKTDYAHIWTIAYSHGCNVVNHMAWALKNQHKKTTPITSVHIASPISPEEAPLVKNINRVYHFYSLADVTQLCGSIEAKGLADSLTDLFEHTRIYNEENVTNIRIQQNGFDLGHFQIKLPVLLKLPHILFTIDTWYSMYALLDVNVDQQFDACTACIRDHLKMHMGTYSSSDIKKAQEHHAQQKKIFLFRYEKNIEERHITAELVS